LIDVTESIPTLFSGLIVTVLGYLIRYRGWTFLVAGYDQETSSVPDEAVAEIAGSTILRIGIATIVLGGLNFYYDTPSYVYVFFAIGVLLAAGRLLYRLNTHEESVD
jgi:hypothetical protein